MADAVKPRRLSMETSTTRVSTRANVEADTSHRFSLALQLEGHRPSLTKIDVFKLRNPSHVSILVDILAQGYCRTYKELFNLVKEEEEAERQFPSRANYVLLKNDKETLSLLAVSLCKCEESGRRGDFKFCYQERALLGKQFKLAHRRVPALHFYRTAAMESLRIGSESGSSAGAGGGGGVNEQIECVAKADIEYGQRLLEEKLLTEAKTYLETAFEILSTREKSGSDLFKECCQTLSRINLELGCEVVSRANKITRVARDLFDESYNLIRQSNDHRATQSVCIQLSEIFTQHNEPKMSRKFLAQVRSKTPNTDLESYCKSCRELAKSLTSSQKYEEALNVLAKSGREIDAVKRREGYSSKMALIKGMNCNLQCRVYNVKGSYGKATQAGHNALYHLQNSSKGNRHTASIAAKDIEGSHSCAKVNLAVARAHAHWADYMDILQQDRDDYDQPQGLLGIKMRGLTAQILYFDQTSNVRMRMDSVSRIPVTSRKSSMPPEDESEEDKTIRVEIGEDDNNSLTSTTQLESFSILNPGRPDVSQHNVSSLSENVLDGLFQKESVNQGSVGGDNSMYYYEYEYETSEMDHHDQIPDEDAPSRPLVEVSESKILTKKFTEPTTTVQLKENEDFFETFKVYEEKNKMLSKSPQGSQEGEEKDRNFVANNYE